MSSKQEITKTKARKIEGMRKIKEAYNAAKEAGTIKTYKIQEIKD